MSAQARRVAALLVTADLTAPDARTTAADLRIALCLARGVRPDGDIDPALGYDMSRRSFDAARASWQGVALDCDAMRAGHDRARAYWVARRPEWSTEWPAEAGEAR